MIAKGKIENMVQAIELRGESPWRRADWRAKHAIPLDTPCIGILWDPAISKRKSSIATLQHTLQELQWTVPGLQLALLAIPQNTEGSNASPGAVGLNPAPQIRGIGIDPIVVLEWLCGMDAWLLMGSSPLALALENLSENLGIPAVAIDAASFVSPHACSRTAGSERWLATVDFMSQSLERSRSRKSLSTFHRPSRGIVVDAAFRMLHRAFEAIYSVPPAVDPNANPLRSAA